jgi:hypothetical protein
MKNMYYFGYPGPLQNLPPKAKKTPKEPRQQPELSSMPLGDWIPDVFSNTQQVPVVQTKSLSEYRTRTVNNPLLMGNYARLGYDPDAPYIQVRPPNVPGQYPSDYNNPSHTAAHEAGHAIWYQDLTPQNKEDWTVIHSQYIQDWKNAVARWKRTNDPKDLGIARPSFMTRYMNDPAHSFADAYGMYVAQPQQLQKESPQAYNFFRNLTGFEYRRPGPM